MSYLIDTDRSIDWLKDRREVSGLLARLAPEGLGISMVTLGELWEGIHFGSDPAGAELGLGRYLQLVRVVPLTAATMRTFGEIRGQLRAAGMLIPDMDLLIAATAVQRRLTPRHAEPAAFRARPRPAPSR